MTEKLKIGFLIGTLDVGGTEKQLVQLCRKLNQTRFAPEVFCMVRKGVLAPTLENARIPVSSLGMRGLRFPLSELQKVLRFVHLVKQRQIQLLVGILPHAVMLGALVSRLAKVPVYVSWRRSSECLQPPKFLPFLPRLTNDCTRLVIANSEAVKNEVIKGELLSPAKVQVIYNGVETETFGGCDRDAGRRTLGIEAHQPIVAVLANFIPYKGHAVFLEAWKDVITHFPRALALLIGSGPTFPQITSMAAAQGLSDSIRFTGTRFDIPEILSAIDVLVHPSLVEGFSNAILEGMASGKPVVASSIGGNPEAVLHGKTGLLVSHDNSQELSRAILELLNDPHEARRMGDRGRTRAGELFPFSKMVQKYETIFQSLAV